MDANLKKQFDSFNELRDMVPGRELSPDDEDFDEDYKQMGFTKEQLATIKSAGAFINSIGSILSKMSEDVSYELGRNVKDSRFWSASTFRC